MSDVIRRDPRAEWIARNRLHPLHGELQAQQASWAGPAGVVRKNPHAVGFMGPNGLRRIDRSGAQQGGNVKRLAAAEAQRPLYRVAEPAFYVAVVPDLVGGRLTAHDRDLLGLAHQLAGNNGAVIAVVFGEHKETAFDTAGVDRLLVFEGHEYAGYTPEQRTQGLQALDSQFSPRHWLFPDSRDGGGELGRRLAARMGERPATRVWQVKDGQCISRAGAGQQDLARPLPRVVLAAAECAEPVDETRHEVLPVALCASVVRMLPRIEDAGAVAVDPAAVPMAEAEFILSGGNGVKDWALFQQAAVALGATQGASRVAVDDGFMTRDRQVGASGTWVTARVYVAVGISGAIQHLQGIGNCDKVIAINLDPNCDMIKRADLAIVGDSAELLRALIDAVAAWRHGAKRNAARGLPMSNKIVTLVSVGAHPTSGRARRAEQDARAVELGLGLVGDALEVLHAGAVTEPALRDYLGMGLPSLQVLEQPAGADVLPALADYLRDAGAQLVLTGSQAETGEGSGMLPYLLGERLGWPVIAGLAQVLAIDNGVAQVLQALPRGQRRRLNVRLPLVATVDSAAPKARQSAYGPARRGELQAHEVEVVPDELLQGAPLQPAKPRPKRLKVIKAKSGADRMKAATAKASGGGGQVLKGVSAQEGAAAVMKLLIEENVLR